MGSLVMQRLLLYHHHSSSCLVVTFFCFFFFLFFHSRFFTCHETFGSMETFGAKGVHCLLQRSLDDDDDLYG